MRIAWSSAFPRWKYPLGYLRLRAAHERRRDRLGLKPGGGFGAVPGDATRLEALRNLHKGERCFIIGNGPSLKKTPVAHLRDEITIGANGLYKAFPEWGFPTRYLLFEDIEQTELHGSKLRSIDGPTKIAAVHNAHAIARPWRDDIIFMNARLADERYWNETGIQFSRDFPQVVYLGSTIVYIALQLAHHLGCDPVYLVGVDFDYGPLADKYPPGKIAISKENIDLLRQTHFSEDYYKEGDLMGVPNYALQQEAFDIARRVFEADGRRIYNATLGGRLETYERVNFDSLFSS